MAGMVLGIDIGNATTEVVLAKVDGGEVSFIDSALTQTTGTKGTRDNIVGICGMIDFFREKYGDLKIDALLLNDAAPVIADFAMDTITETVITDSTMIGHNPETPGGEGMGVGQSVELSAVREMDRSQPYIVIVKRDTPFDRAAEEMNQLMREGYTITGAIIERDEGTLISNRLERKIPIIDEVKGIERVPLGVSCAVEVAPTGRSIDTLANPYGIAGVFHLTPEETEYSRFIAKALIGNRSAVVLRTPRGEIRERTIPAGDLMIIGKNYTKKISVDCGGKAIMNAVEKTGDITDFQGTSGTNIGGMLENIKVSMSKITELPKADIRITDVWAVDTESAIAVQGALAGECAMENGVALACMVKTDRSFMAQVAQELELRCGIPVIVGGVEGEMQIKGVLTTPGTKYPLIAIDVGAGSTDAAYMNERGEIISAHMAGAGDLVTKIINNELNLRNPAMAENVKISILAKVEGLSRIRYENGDVVFLKQPLPPAYFGRVCVVDRNGELHALDTEHTMEKIREVRRNAKKKVLVENVKRVLRRLRLDHNVCNHVVLVGGSFLDDELANMITEELSSLRIVAGKGNIRGVEGPRSAVATGLVLNYAQKNEGGAR